MSATTGGLISLLRDLEAIERSSSRAEESSQASLILDSILRRELARGGAIYLRERGEQHGFRAVSSHGVLVSKAVYDGDVPVEVTDDATAITQIRDVVQPPADTIVPLSRSRDCVGFLALSRDGRALTTDDRDTLDSAGRYIATLLENHRLAEELRDGGFQLRYRIWELESLYDIGLSIASTLDLDRLSDEILVRTMSLLNSRRAALYLKRGTHFVLHQSLGDVRADFFEKEIAPDVCNNLIACGKPVSFDQGADCLFPGCTTFVALPIFRDSEVIGVLTAADREHRDGSVGAFDQNDIRLLSQFATQVGIALENARLHQEGLEKQRLERDLEVAATIQADILPRKLPQSDRYDVAVYSRPARQLGGDYYTFIERDGEISLCIADVAGKSVPAAILVSALHAAVHLLFAEGRELGDIATELNRHLHRWSSDTKFITVILVTVDVEGGFLRFVNAGHNPAYVVRGDTIDPLPSHGLPVGLMAQSRYATQMRPFSPGSMLVLYTDGITEAENAADEEFDYDRLQEVLRGSSELSLEEIRDRVAAAVDAFTGEVPQKDDQTLVLLRSK